MQADSLLPLRTFVSEVTETIDQNLGEEKTISQVRQALSKLIATDAWLPEKFRATHPKYYQQYLLYCDPKERFSVQSFVWGPGQFTPVHDHTVWGLVGVLQGAELCQRYRQDALGKMVKDGGPVTLEKGEIDLVSPQTGDVHTVSNAYTDRTSISIHVYGANIGNTVRNIFIPDTSEVKPFVSGYSSEVMPNLWDRASLIRTSLAAQSQQ